MIYEFEILMVSLNELFYKYWMILKHRMSFQIEKSFEAYLF